jgi:hypothetical protein
MTFGVRHTAVPGANLARRKYGLSSQGAVGYRRQKSRRNKRSAQGE